MATAEQMIANLRSRASLVASQVAAGLDRDTLLVSQAQAFLVEVRAAGQLTVNDVTMISIEIVNGPWGLTEKTALATAVAAQASRPAQQRGQKQHRENQTMTYVERYLTDRDWACLADSGTSVEAKLHHLAERLWLLGVTCPSIPLLKRAVAKVVLVGLPAESRGATAETKQQWCKTLKGAIKSIDSQRDHPSQHVKISWEPPTDMPQSSRTFAYKDGGPAAATPGAVTPFALDAAVRSFGYKHNHGSLKAAQTTSSSPSSALAVPGGAHSSGGPFMGMEGMSTAQGMQFLMQMAPFVNQLMKGGNPDARGRGQACPITFNRTSQRGSAAPSLAPTETMSFASHHGTLSAATMQLAAVAANSEQDLTGFESQLSGPSSDYPSPPPPSSASGAVVPCAGEATPAFASPATPQPVLGGPPAPRPDPAQALEAKVNESAAAAGSHYQRGPVLRRPAAAIAIAIEDGADADGDEASPLPKAKGKAKAQPKAKGNAKGRAKAAAKPQGKDPKGVMTKNGVTIDIRDVIAKESIDGRDCNTFASRAYGRAKSQAKAGGLEPSVVTEIAKWGFAVAAEAWKS
ncbi:unnamed protein product [Prorocentrum cordatum]|uniref:Uncharacterized protein n=1 Tax=Prorocentrum cordatum TaxID=2364126 RepID=A0ABN9UK05_9DINO|nr:unnamed protein product [Polarella glacialis]